MTDPVRWGVLGTGFAAVQFCDGLAEVEGAQVAAVGSNTLARAQRLASRCGTARAHGSYEALFADPDVDAIYIASGHPQHLAHCRAAFAAGKSVLCEKPLAMNADEARQIVEGARTHGVFFMEALRTRFLPALARARELLAQGALGEVRHFQAALGHRNVYDPDSRFFDPAQGGGALLDLGVYPLSLALALFGRPQHITSQVVRAPTGVDHDFQALLDFGGGRTASIACSLHSALPADAWLCGDQATLRLHGPLYNIERLSLIPGPPLQGMRSESLDQFPGRREKLKRIGVLRQLHAGLSPVLRSLRGRGEQCEWRPGSVNGFTDEAAEATRCLRAGLKESPLMPLDDSLMLMETLDAIRASWPSAT